MRRRLLIGLVVLGVALPVSLALRRYVHGFTLVVRAADLHGAIRRLADVDSIAIREEVVIANIAGRSIRLRAYTPLSAPRQTVLLVSGLHPAGIDEPRLIGVARRLAEADVAVVTPDIPELSRFEITAVVTDRIEEAAVWLATASGLAPSGRIGLMGISFSGGLAIVAAGRPPLRTRLLYVFSFGGHDDLRRVLEYFCTGFEADASTRPSPVPHDYGVAVVLLNVADRLVPVDQVDLLQNAVRRFLWASYLDRADKRTADREFSALRDLARSLPEPSATLLKDVNDRNVAALGKRLQPFIGLYVDQSALSPSRSTVPHIPVFLLHGRDDNVIPAAESRRLAARLRGHVPVHLLVTDLISHADADQPAHIGAVIELARFWGDLLAQ